MQLRVAAHKVDNAQHRTDALRQHGGGRCAAHAHAKRPHKGDIQPDVEHAAEQQKQQRRDAVAHSAQQGGFHIIKHRQGNAQQNQGQVGGGTVPHLGGDLQSGQQGIAAQQGSKGQHKGHRHGEGDHPADSAAHSALITRAEVAADAQRQTVVHTEGKVHN